MNPVDEKFRLLMLSNELAALLHDIGKYSSKFVKAGIGKGDPQKAHTTDYFKDCGPLQKVLFETPVPQGWLEIPDDDRLDWQYLGELAKYHHYNKELFVKRFGEKFNGKLPSTLYLAMIADSTDSAASKSSGRFDDSILDKKKLKQTTDRCYLADPLGNYAKFISLEELDEKSKEFQHDLADLLRQALDCQDNIKALIDVRKRIIRLLRNHFSQALAETRLPNNDVSLWQHTYSTCALFKAMLAGHALNNDWSVCDENGNPAFYLQNVAIMGITWEQQKLLSMSHRSAEILGLRQYLDKAVQGIKCYLETELCLGNEIYRDGDGIYFLIPDLKLNAPEQPEIYTKILSSLYKSVDSIIDKSFKGVLDWTVKYHPIGLNLLELSKVIQDSNNAESIIFSGPANPTWISSWQGADEIEACSRCNLFPKSMEPVKSGSEGDKPCEFCENLANTGKQYRNLSAITQDSQEQQKRLLGIDHTAEYSTFDMEVLAGSQEGQEDPSNRLVLIQGVFDLSRVFNGQVFSYIIESRPEDFTFKKGKDTDGKQIETWEKILDVVRKNWEILCNEGQSSVDWDLKSLKQIFQDSYLGSKSDSRVQGSNAQEKTFALLKRYLEAPFPNHLESEHSRLVNYALRQHPAPSRSARFWESTLQFNRLPIRYCEQHKIQYTPLSLDPQRFMILVSADQARQLIDHIYQQYTERFSRVRHLVPLHLSATVFYHKSPLYIAIDAARRFERVGMHFSSNPKFFLIKDIYRTEQVTQVQLKVNNNLVTWNIPNMLYNGQKDEFYSWYRIKGVSEYPVHLSELKPGMEIEVYPSSFDYEVLDATVRRYDIFPVEESKGRPHLIAGESGPRPYNLERLPVWKDCEESIDGIEEHQAHMLMGKLAALHQEWPEFKNASVFETMVRDYLLLALGKTEHHMLSELVKMGCQGELSDIFEWNKLISK